MSKISQITLKIRLQLNYRLNTTTCKVIRSEEFNILKWKIDLRLPHRNAAFCVPPCMFPLIFLLLDHLSKICMILDIQTQYAKQP